MSQLNITSGDIVKRHEKELALVPFVYKNARMAEGPEKPYFEQGRRLRWLRQAERIPTALAFAKKFNWPQSGMSQFETGARRVPTDKLIQLQREITGFDANWIWHGEKRGLSFDLRLRIEAEEAKELARLGSDTALSRREG